MTPLFVLSGFMAAGFTKAAVGINGLFENVDGPSLGNTIKAAVLGGGKFANGAVSAAFSYVAMSGAQAQAQVGVSPEVDAKMRESSEVQPYSVAANETTFGECVNQCIVENYGESYNIADRLNPLSVVGAITNEVSEYLEGRLTDNIRRYRNGSSLELNKYSYRTQRAMADRMAITLKIFKGFGITNAVLGAGAVGYQLGAQGYCRFKCRSFAK